MKNQFLVLFISLFLCSCSELDSRVNFELSGPRTLRKMTQLSGQSITGSSSFFLFSGSSSFQSNPAVQVIFSWKMNDGTYAISSVPLTTTRIKFDPKAETPTISFHMKPGKYYVNGSYTEFMSDMQNFFDVHLEYLEIRVKESDWQPDIQLPMNKEKMANKN